jgi:hypothetical protein
VRWQAYRSGTSLLEGEALDAIPEILHRALTPAFGPGEQYTDRVNGIGLGPCAPLWSGSAEGVSLHPCK